MIIIETCPNCGHDLVNAAYTTYPPIPYVYCPACGFRDEGDAEKIVRVPYGGNCYKPPQKFLPETIRYEMNDQNGYCVSVSCSSGGDGEISTLGTDNPYCPECGHLLEHGVYTMSPTIPFVRCPSCGYEKKKSRYPDINDFLAVALDEQDDLVGDIDKMTTGTIQHCVSVSCSSGGDGEISTLCDVYTKERNKGRKR